MGKGLAIIGFILSLIFPVILLFGNIASIIDMGGGVFEAILYSFAPIGLLLTIIGLIINLVVLIKKFDGKKFAILGLVFNIPIIIFFLIRIVSQIFLTNF